MNAVPYCWSPENLICRRLKLTVTAQSGQETLQ